jgi:iron complex outermembrane receptor protein
MMTRHALGRLSITSLWVPALLCAGGVAVCAEPDDYGIPEIVVTAQKYESTIQNTPFSISALSGEQLAAAGITTIEGLAREVPGLSMRSAGPGQTEYEARGLASNGGAAPTVGFYLDEVPLSPPAAAQVGKVVIDPNLYDINRIELLRGPQGTLYGSGSMGGTIRVVTNQPELKTFGATFQGTVSYTDGGNANGSGNFMVNIPLGETLALRLVGSDTYRSGWIDRVVVSPFPPDSTVRGNVLAAPVQSVATDANTEKLVGGRASLLFKPSDALTITATALYQRMNMGGYDEYDQPPGPSYMARYEAFNIPEPISDTAHINSLTIIADLGFADFTSATAYWDRDEGQTQDASESFSYITGLANYVSIPYEEIDQSRQFSQELRLTSKGGEGNPLRWTVGAFYSDLHSNWIEFGENTAFAALSSPPSDNPRGILFNGDNKYHIEQDALFADGSYDFTNSLTFSSGLRWYRYDSSQFDYLFLAGQAYGYYAPSLLAPAVAPGTLASDRGFNPRFNLSYRPNQDLTTYASVSKGFRPGGANQIVASFCGKAPGSFGPDSVWNYEIGEKAKLFDNWLTINSDIYYIKWLGVQQTLLLPCGYEYGANAGDGRSYGPELEINAKLSPEWTLSLSGTYTDAKINHPSALFASQIAGVFSSCPTVSNCSGPILNVPKDTGSLSISYSTKVLADYQLTARVTDNYVGSSTDESYSYLTLPSYNLVQARVGMSADKWSAHLFVTNLTNKIAEVTANNTSFQVNIPGLVRISTVQPRTVGTEFDYRF